MTNKTNNNDQTTGRRMIASPYQPQQPALYSGQNYNYSYNNNYNCNDNVHSGYRIEDDDDDQRDDDLLLSNKFHVVVPAAIASMSSHEDNLQLRTGYQPTEYDVVCGRGKGKDHGCRGLSKRCWASYVYGAPLYHYCDHLISLSRHSRLTLALFCSSSQKHPNNRLV